MTAKQSGEQVRKQLWKSAGNLALRIHASIAEQLERQTKQPLRGWVEIRVWLGQPAGVAVQVEAETVLGAKENNDER